MTRKKDAVLHKRRPASDSCGRRRGKNQSNHAQNIASYKKRRRSHNILAITFTNKAAKEMQDRVAKLLREDKALNMPLSFNERPFMSTFHALGAYILRENSEHIGLTKHFAILDDGDTTSIMKEALGTLSLDPKQWEPRRMKNAISRQKGDVITMETYAAGAGNEYFPRVLSSVWRAYEKSSPNTAVWTLTTFF